MAFGLGYNKAKSLAVAEKFVMQGKIPAAIQEYQKILEHEPRDLVILNTVGDLHLRLNKTAEALTYFYKLGEAYVDDGFVRNGIAVYKKITRSDANAIQAVSRLADLYLQQGQLSEARNYLNQAIEYHTAHNEPDKCVELFEKLLLMDPENATAKQRLAAVYEKAGKKEDAAAMYYSAAEGLADRANPAEAEKALKKARELGLDNADVTVLESRIQIDSGRGAEAISSLQQLPDWDSNRSALNLLYHAHLSSGDPTSAGEIAVKIFEKFEDFAGVEQVATMMIDRGDTADAVGLYERVSERAIAQRSTQPVCDGLKSVLQQDPTNTRARRLLCRVYEGSGETGEYVDASELLADLLAQHSDFEGARNIYAKLAEMEPANPMHKQRMRQMDQKLGRATAEAVAETLPDDAPALVADFDMPEAPPATSFSVPAASTLDPATQQIVDSALMEADQQSAFMQYDEAVQALHNALGQAPGNVQLNQKLVEIFETSQKWPEAAVAADAVTEALVMSGDGEGAARYGEMAVRFRAQAGGTSAPPPVAAAPTPEPASEPGVMEFMVPDEAPMGVMGMDVPPSAPQDTFALPDGFSVDTTETHEVDLSNEWEALMVEDVPVAEEILAEPAAPAPPPEESFTIPSFEEPAPPPPPVEVVEVPVEETPVDPFADAPTPATTHHEEEHHEEDFALDLGGLEEPAAQESFELSLEMEAPPPPPPAPAPAAPAGLDDLWGSLDDGSSGPVTPPATKAAPPAPPKPAPPPPAAKPSGIGLSDVFADFKQEMEQDSAVESDIENHYNMGVAFKEMGLYDEAIGEFQKAYHGAEHLPNNPNFIPVCTLLAHCFMEKSLPELAVKWLENALKAPGLDREGEMALRYEIGASQEVAGLKPAALESFMLVYSMNIDYRDVADRIRTLKGN